MVKHVQKDKSRTGKPKMMIPIRCFSCGKPVAHLWEDFLERKKKEDVKTILDDMKLERHCCRSILMGHVDLIDVTSKFKKS